MNRATLLVAFVLLISTVVSAQSEGYVAASNARGLVPENSFLVGDIDNVNLASGGVNLHIPLYTRTGRGISLAGYLNYGSKFWYQNPEFGLYGELDAMAWSQGPDFSFQLGSLGRLTEDDQEYDCTYNNQEYTETVYSAFIYRAADGSSYRFPNLRKETTLAGHYCQNTGLNVINQGASDGGGMMLDTTQHPYMLYHKDGSKECVDSNYYSCPVILTDSNGNTITEGTGGTVVDTMKRSFNPGLTPTMTQTVVDSNGNTQTFTWALQGTFSGTTQFPSTVEAGSVQVIQNTDFFQGTKTLTLPDQRQYVFSFDPNFGDLIRVDLPTGGYIRYQYVTLPAVDLIPSPTDGSCCLFALDSRRVSARFVSSTGLAQDEKEWQYSYNGNVTTVTDPLGNVSVHTFSTDDRFDPAYEVEAQYYQGSATLLKTVVTTWGHDWGVVVQDNKARTSAYANWRQMSVTTTLNDTNQVKEETYTYDSYTLNMPESLGNILTHSEYDWGTGSPGPLRRYTAYSYLNNNNSNYANKHIDDRVASKTIYDSTGNTCQGQSRPCAETTYGYDTSSIATKSGVVQHDYTDYPASMIYRGNLTTTSVWRNTDSAWLTTTNYYNEVGNLTETTDSLSHPTYFDYSDSWSGTACIPSGGAASAFVTKITNALNQITTAKYFPCSSLAASATDSNSQTTSFAYDGLDRQTQDSFPDLGQTTNCYSDDSGSGCYSSSVPPYIVTTRTRDSSPSDNIINTTLVDGLGRVSQTQLNSDPEGVDYVDTIYDAFGRKSIVSNPHRSASNPTDGNTTYAYDALGRIQTVTKQDGSVVSTAYSGNCATVTDEAGKVRKSCTDGLGRLSKVFEAPTGPNYETDYTYDALDKKLPLA